MSTNIPLMYSLFGLAGTGGKGDSLWGQANNKERLFWHIARYKLLLQEQLALLHYKAMLGRKGSVVVRHIFIPGLSCKNGIS